MLDDQIMYYIDIARMLCLNDSGFSKLTNNSIICNNCKVCTNNSCSLC